MDKLKNYLRDYLETTKKHYIETPELISQDHNIEKSKTEEYAGRQFFELIQNADDAAESANLKNMLIMYDNERLIIANNGEPFSIQGYRSLFYSHTSSKINKDLIGNKGLGFRSVLSWEMRSRYIVMECRFVFPEILRRSSGTSLNNNQASLIRFLRM